MKKHRFQKEDYYNSIILILLFVLLILLMVDKGYLFGSTTDWDKQHTVFPEYFRSLFLETHDFFPDFAFQIGGGQNIYHFSYYGLFNPIIMLSYFLPITNMYNYISFSMLILVLASVLLFYKFLRNHQVDARTSLLTSIFFMCASSLLFHAHRQIMFVNYMPFLILALMGVDNYFDEQKSSLLSISVFLIILMSYYYSVVSILVIILYGIYQYIARNEKITLKSFFVDGMKFLFPIIIGILLAGILLVPTLFVVLKGRGGVNGTPSIQSLLFPKIHLRYLLYQSYGLGLSAIAVFSLFALFFQKKEQKFLGIFLLLPILFPGINYVLNGALYIDAKSLIPFLPLYALSIALFLQDVQRKEKYVFKVMILGLLFCLIGNYCFESVKSYLKLDLFLLFVSFLLYYKTSLKLFLSTLLILCPIMVTLKISETDNLVWKENLYGSTYFEEKKLLERITEEDSGIYRISNQIHPSFNANRTFGNLKYYMSTIYSSTYHAGYNYFYYDIFNNAMSSRNKFTTSFSGNYPFLAFMGHKYLLTEEESFIGYTKWIEGDDLTVYKSDNVLPLAYASSHLVSLHDFNVMGYPYNQDILLKNIVVDKDTKTKASSSIQKVSLDLNLEELEALSIEEEKGIYSFEVAKKQKITLPLKEPLSHTLLFIHFKVLRANACKIGDTEIVINGISNKLTCSTWKYHNGNYTFDYVLPSDQINQLEIILSSGNYQITDVEFYTLDYEDIAHLRENVDEFLFDVDKTKGDIMEGDISVTEDGYFALNVPYDSGFIAYVDGKEQSIEKVNVAMLGFPIEKGNHHIKIEYHSPGKKEGIALSFLGIFLGTLTFIHEHRGRKKENFSH